MNNKYLYRIVVWSILVIAGVLITLNVHRMVVKNSVLVDIAKAESDGKQYEGSTGDINRIINQINLYNDKVYEDSKFSQMIPTGYDEKEIILNYVEAPLLIVGAEKLSVHLTEAMPANIDWTSNTNSKDIQGIKVAITFNIRYDKLDDLIAQLRSSIRLVYFGDINFVIPDESDDEIQVKMNYYLFYKSE